MQSYRSCRVRRVLVYVVVGEIALQNARSLGAGMQVHNDPHLATGQVDQVAGLRRFSAPADRDPVDRHVDLVWLEGGIGGADGGQDPTPVGILAEYRRLEQIA